MHRRPSQYRLLFLTCVLLLAASGCAQAENTDQDPPTAVPLTPQADGSPDETPSAQPTTESQADLLLTLEEEVIVATPDSAREAVELDIPIIGSLTTLDPQRTNSQTDLNLIENLFVGLTRFNHQSQQVEPALAASWESSSDGRTWTFTLRDDVYWIQPIGSTGIVPVLGNAPVLEEVQTVRRVVAEDFVFAVQRVCSQETANPDAIALFIIEGCEGMHRLRTVTDADRNALGISARDPFTLEVQLNQPATYFLSITSLALMRPVPREVVMLAEAEDADWTEPERLLTNGPFLYGPSSLPETRIVLEKNPFYPLERRGNADRVNLTIFENVTDAFELWEDRGLDITPLPVSLQETFIAESPQKVFLQGEQTAFFLNYAFDSDVFDEIELRRAFGAAINRERLVEEVYGQRGIPMKHLTPAGAFGAPPIDQIGMGYDPDYARQQMAASSYGACRFLPPMVYMTRNSDEALFQAELLRDMWIDELGCEIENIIIQQVPFGTLLANTRPEADDSRPDMFDLGWASYYPDANNWLSDIVHCEESLNRSNRPCGAVDQLILRAQTAVSEQRIGLYREIESQLFSTDGLEPLSPLYASASFFLRQTWIVIDGATFGGEQYDTYFVDWELKKIEKRQ